MAEHFDLVVFGGGPGGYVTAIRASQLGLKTAVVEEQYWGGICLNVGCILSKSLLKGAEVAHISNHKAKTFGISGGVFFDFGAVHARLCKVSADVVRGVHFLIEKNKITEINGLGEFTGPISMAITDGDDKGKEITFDKAVIATGSVVRPPLGAKIGGNIVSCEEQILSDEPPDSTVIVGAGAIGMEFAYVLANYGVNVTIVEFMDNVLPNEGTDISKAIAEEYKKLGVKLMTGHKTTSIVDNGDSVEVKAEAKDGGDEQTLTVGRIMVFTGFAPCTEGVGPDRAGVELGEHDEIVIDRCMCTNVDNVYTIDDVTMKLQLAHVIETQGVIVAEHMAGHETEIIPGYLMMPCATPCSPQVTSFGRTEAQAKKWTEENGRGIKVSTLPFSVNDKARGLAESAGFIKLTVDAEYGELLGGHMVSANVSKLVPQLVLAEKYKLTAKEIGRAVHTYPMMSKAMREAAEGVMGETINL